MEALPSVWPKYISFHLGKVKSKFDQKRENGIESYKDEKNQSQNEYCFNCSVCTSSDT